MKADCAFSLPSAILTMFSSLMVSVRFALVPVPSETEPEPFFRSTVHTPAPFPESVMFQQMTPLICTISSVGLFVSKVGSEDVIVPTSEAGLGLAWLGTGAGAGCFENECHNTASPQVRHSPKEPTFFTRDGPSAATAAFIAAKSGADAGAMVSWWRWSFVGDGSGVKVLLEFSFGDCG